MSVRVIVTVIVSVSMRVSVSASVTANSAGANTNPNPISAGALTLPKHVVPPSRHLSHFGGGMSSIILSGIGNSGVLLVELGLPRAMSLARRLNSWMYPFKVLGPYIVDAPSYLLSACVRACVRVCVCVCVCE